MDKLLLIARREYVSNIRRPGFLFGTFGLPLIMVGLFVLISAISIQSLSTVSDQVGYGDASGVLAAGVGRPDNFTPFASEDEAQAAFDAGTVGAVIVIPENYMSTGDVTFYVKSDITEALSDNLSGYIRANLQTGLNPEEAERLINPVELSVRALDSGRVVNSSGVIALFLAPIIFSVVFMMGTQITSGYLMSSVVEEKSSRLVEMLVTSVSPGQLLGGKIIGLGLLGLTQLFIWIAGGLLIIALGQSTAVLAGFSFPSDFLLLSLTYFILGYLLISSIMAGVGAVVGSEQESRQIAGLFTLPLVLPYFFIFQFITEPDGTLAVFFSLFPLTSPIANVLRLGFTSVPAWQVIASFALLIVSCIFTTWISARIFRWALLRYGKRPSLRQLIGAVVRNEGMQTTATGERAG